MLFVIMQTCFSVNHMDLIFMMQGVTPYGDFGAGLAALDFNGDGYDDLAILQRGWTPDSLVTHPPTVRYGRILVYYGGPGFDSEPDFILEGTYNYQFMPNGGDANFADLGDVNGDGFDDLGIKGFTEGMRPYISVYFGGENPSHQPGYYKDFPAPQPYAYAEIDPLGDINNDGYDDIGYTYLSGNAANGLSRTAIILGGSMTEVILREYDIGNGATINGAGDANHDGFDDYIVTYQLGTGQGHHTDSNTLYFGSVSILPADSLLLYSNQNFGAFIWRTKYLGDLNGDGIDDFTGLILYPNTSVWYGNQNLSSQCNIILTPAWSGNNSDDRGLIHGDLNGDGFDDVIGSLPIEYGEYGAFCIWLGGTNMNGTGDLIIGGPLPGMLCGMLLGTGMAAGDFNGDGLCDVAASAPHSSTFDEFPGRVYIYAGNAQLVDTTVGVEDNTLVPAPDKWSFTVIPNPINGKQNWKLRFTGKGYDKFNNSSVRIYNLKGQKVKTYNITNDQIKAGEATFPILNLSRGIYEVSLYQKGKLLKTQKLTLK